ncbi:MAG: hypothetical protein ACOYJ2_03935 [Rickettsiales bacterium]
MTIRDDDGYEEPIEAHQALVARDAVTSDYGDFTIDRKRLDILLAKDGFIPWGDLLPMIARHLRLKGDDELSQNETWKLFVDEVCNRAPALVSSEDRIRVSLQDPKPVVGFAEAVSLYLRLPASDLMIAHLLQAETGKEVEVDKDGTLRLDLAGLEAGAGMDGGAAGRRQRMATMIDPRQPVPDGMGPYQRFEQMRALLRNGGERTGGD